MNTYTVTVSWEKIHELFTRLDEFRRPLGLGTFELHFDVFGGTYWGPHYEERGLRGLIALPTSTDRLAQEVWNKIHGLHREVRDNKCTREQAIEHARKLVGVALAIAAAKLYLHTIGLRGDPAEEVCGTGDGAVTGLHWLAGKSRDNGASLVEMARFASEGVSALTDPVK